MMDYGMGMSWGAGWIGMLLVWLVPVALLAAAIKYLFLGDGFVTRQPRETGNRALALLEERYAKGELQRDEFLQKRSDILGS
jgi:putative membrane protein